MKKSNARMENANVQIKKPEIQFIYWFKTTKTQCIIVCLKLRFFPSIWRPSHGAILAAHFSNKKINFLRVIFRLLNFKPNKRLILGEIKSELNKIRSVSFSTQRILTVAGFSLTKIFNVGVNEIRILRLFATSILLIKIGVLINIAKLV